MRWNALFNGQDGRRPGNRARPRFALLRVASTAFPRWLPACALVFALGGCATGSGFSERIGQGMQAVGLGGSADAEADTPRSVSLRLHAGSNLNGGSPSQPLALVATVFVLRDRQRFDAAAFDTFLDESDVRSALGDDLLGMQELLLLPNQRYEHQQALDAEGGYVGIVALFRKPAGARWRFVFDAGAIGPAGVLVGLHACAMTTTSDALRTPLGSPAHTLSATGCPD